MISKGRSAAFLLLVSALWPAVSRAATVTVTGTGDTVAVDGAVTLREAIASINGAANVNADVVAVGIYGTADTINFAIPGTGVHTIQPTSGFVLTKPVTINGYSQPGSSANTLAVGNDAVLTIELDGSNAAGLVGGLIHVNGGNATVRGLVINRAPTTSSFGVDLESDGNTIAGNFVGSNPAGSAAFGNGCAGIWVGADNNTIGGASPADRNLIAGGGNISCGANITLAGDVNTHLLNNYIGTNAAGTASLGGSFGINLDATSGAIVGGTTAAERNVISGNSNAGIRVFSNSHGCVIEGNFIGTNASGTAALANGRGIQINESSHDIVIGGTAAGAGNRIAFNSGFGIVFLSVSPAGLGNSILGNAIYSNAGLGIDLRADGVSANDDCDADGGTNGLQNFPVITSATAGAGTLTVQGTLNSTANTGPYRIEIFASDSCDASGNGEGQTFLGSTTASTDGTCAGAFNVTLPVTVAPTARLTATATAPDGSTSEFSACFGIQTSFFTVAPCRVADTRNAPGPSGGPALAANTTRTFPVSGICGIPASARAVAINMAVFNPSNDGDLRVYPAGVAAPLASSINFRPGIVRANNAVVPLGTAGQISVQCDMPAGSTNFFFDVYGYFQ